MSLDINLFGKPQTVECICSECDHKHTREVAECFYRDNITHNLNRMADAAGIYVYLWRPEEAGVTTARQLIEPLKEGLARLEHEPEYYSQFNPPNGWGDYAGFVKFVREYLRACEQHPEATVSAWR